ncbi:MAG: alpha/beta fold hydrolase [Psychromonas sp.]|nr:alpha/beta fold hydrolase [Alteromonadales bacterium]MCP5077691.1 alpha/beta fold hydrolase [Psychromonas sp.]
MMQQKKSLLFIYLFLLCTTLSFATSNMINNPFNIINEQTLTNNFNSNILDFWKKNAQSTEFQGVDNKKVHTVSITTGNNKAVVISQGRNESVLSYKEVTYELHLQGYDVFLIDHRGQGFSERFGGDQHRGYVVDFQDYVDDLNQYVNSLQLDKKYQQRYLLSHSMGGTISALYLQQYNTPFQATAFFSPMFSINLGSWPTFLAKIISYSSAEVCSWFSDKACYTPGGKGYIKSKFEGNPLSHSEVRFNSSQNGFEELPQTQLGDATMRWVSTSISATEQAIKNADKIEIPLIIFEAGDDSIVTNEGQKAFFSNVTNCKLSRFLTIKGSKHEILLERDEYRNIAMNHALQFFSEIAQGNLTCIK